MMNYKVTGITLQMDNPYSVKRKLNEIREGVDQDLRDLPLLLETIAEACMIINGKVAVAGLNNLYGHAGGAQNDSGDVQKKIDVLSNNILINTLRFCDEVGIITSEEVEEAIFCNDNGKYVVSMDPLDGSGNIDCNVSIGTIFGIWRKKSEGKGTIEDDVLRAGKDIVASGYCIYGASTILVIAYAGQVNGFTYDPACGCFILSHPNIRIPEQGEMYSVNEGNSRHWYEATTEYVHSKKVRKEHKSATLRYIGTMVSDVHRTLLYGGVFMYPADKRWKGGKLRMLYECAPLSYLIETAGGKAISGRNPLLDIIPTTLHARVGIVLGSKIDVEEILDFHTKYRIAEDDLVEEASA